MPIIELSHVIHPGMVTYPGLPGPEITPHLTREASTEAYAPGTTFEINRISLVGNTGTYVDSPVHRYADGADLSQLPLDRLADLPGVVISTPGPAVDRATLSVDRATLSPYPVAGHAVLVHTGWDRHFGTAAYGSPEHPYLTAEAAEWLVAYPHRRAPHRAGTLAPQRFPLPRGTAAPGRDGLLPGPRLRDRDLTGHQVRGPSRS